MLARIDYRQLAFVRVGLQPLAREPRPLLMGVHRIAMYGYDHACVTLGGQDLAAARVMRGATECLRLLLRFVCNL